MLNLRKAPGQVFQTVRTAAPWTKAHKLESIRAEAERQTAVEKEKTALMGGATGAAGMSVSEKDTPALEKTNVNTINEFKKLFADAIMYGYQRDSTLATDDADIRNVVRESGFINTVANATADSPFATPIESDDASYAKGMRSVRAGLAEKLRSGNVSSLCNNELDILVSTIMAVSPVNGTPLTPDAYNAFFDFLENASQHGAPGNEGAFIADVLLTLVTRNTMDEQMKVETMRKMAEVTTIDRTLEHIADPMLEKAVAQFKQSLDGVLNMPTTALNTQLDVPGLGYACREGISAAVAERAEAIAAAGKARTAYDAADAAQKNEDTLANKNAVQDTAAALQSANARWTNANQAILAIVPEAATSKDPTPIIQQLVEQEQEMLRLSKKFGDAFRSAFIECRRNGKGMEEKSVDKPDDKTGLDKLGDSGHPLVMTLTREAKEVATAAGEYGPEKVGPKILALETSVADARLPRVVTDELLAVTARMKETQGTAADREIEITRIETRYGYPVKSAARCAMRSYAEMRTGRIPDEQWITARLRFQGDANPKSLNLKHDGFRRLKNDMQRMMHLQMPESKWLSYPIHVAGFAMLYYPGKWFVKTTFGNDNFKKSVRNQRTMFIDKNGRKRESSWKRKHTGILQAAAATLVATAFVGPLVSSINFSVKHNHGVLNGIAKWYFRMPPAQLSVAPGRLGLLPGDWWTPRPGMQDTLRTYDDDINIPERLSERGYDHYKSAFGVGNDTTQAASKRLKWLEERPGVLRFFQERTSGVHVNGWRNLPKNAATLKFDTVSIADGQEKRVVGSDTIPATERQVTTQRVWKTLRMDTVRIADGLVLNRANADAFVDTLMAMEARNANGKGFLNIGAKKLDYAFMTNAANKIAWEDNGFLVPTERLAMMERLRIKDNGNSLFVTLQPGVADTSGPLGMRAKLGASQEYLEKPDTFVTLWRQNVTKLSGEDPTQVAVPEQTLRTAFDSTRAALWGTAIRSSTVEFEEAQIMRQVGALHLSDATTEMLKANKDVRGMLLQFGGTSGYNLNPYRIEDFVQRLASYKQKGGKIEDFSPFMRGARVGWAMGQGYFATRQFAVQEVQEAGATDTMHAQPRHGALSAAAKAFYASPGAGKLDSVLSEMHANEGGKQRIYDFLTGTGPRADAARRLARVTVSGQGAGMTVTITDRAELKKWLATYVRR